MILVLLSTFSLNVHAQELQTTFVSYGITEEGITYHIYGETLSFTENSITVTRNIIYEGNVTPSITLSWSEEINGINYSGTLRLIRTSYSATDNQTTATYQGTLYKSS